MSVANPENKDEDQNAIPPETDWPKPNIWPPRQWPVNSKQFISNFSVVIGVLIGFIVIIGCIFLLYDIIRTYFDTNNEKQFAELRNSLFILAALIGAPFLVWRTMIASKQAETAQEQAVIAQEKAYTELFTQAVEQLGSVKPVGKDQYEVNIEVRVGALYALERIMHDSDKDAKTIIDTLCTYVKHNCGDPKNFEEEITHKEVTELRENPPANRYDIQTALTIIGRRPEKYKTKETMPDLTKVNLQGVNLVRFDLSLCNLANAHLNGADLQMTELQKVDLRGADLEGTNLDYANLQMTNLTEVRMQRASLVDSNLRGTHLLGADLWEADLEAAKFGEVSITLVNTLAASVLWVNFTKTECEFVGLQDKLTEMFGHKTQTYLPEGMNVPDHWSEADVNTIEGYEQYMRDWEAFKKKMRKVLGK